MNKINEYSQTHTAYRDDVVVEDHLGDMESLSIGIYVDDKFTGCFWDSHEQTNDWIINDINITDNLCDLGCDFDEDDYQSVFILCAKLTHNISGVKLLKTIMETFDYNYNSDEGIITELKK